MEKKQNSWKVRRLCQRCGKIYFGEPNSYTCNKPKCNLVVATSILRNAVKEIREKRALTPEQKQKIIEKAINRVI